MLQNKEQGDDNAKNVKDEDEFSFAMQYEIHLRNICKWITDSRAMKHMASHRVALDTYEVVCPCNVRLGDDSVSEVIRIGSINVGVEMNSSHGCALHAEVANQLAISE